MKSFTRLILISVIVSALAVFTATLAHALGYGSSEESVTAVLPAQFEKESRSHLGQSLPIRLVIPQISVDAHVQNVGITKSGAMATPKGFTDVGWYRYGPLPGDAGLALIAGHVDNALGLDGVFKNLSALRQGDAFAVLFADGSEKRFAVNLVEQVPYDSIGTLADAHPSDPTLVLITCGGNWIQSAHSYSERLIVFARLSQ